MPGMLITKCTGGAIKPRCRVTANGLGSIFQLNTIYSALAFLQARQYVQLGIEGRAVLRRHLPGRAERLLKS